MLASMIDIILKAIPLGFFLAFLLGPVFFVLLETAALKGFKAAISFDIGVIVADIVFLCIAYFSTSKLLNSIKDDPALFIFGGGILITYGLITYIKGKKAVNTHNDNEVRQLKKSDIAGLFAKGFLLNFVNIGVLGFWLGLIIIFGPQLDMQPDKLLVFFASVLLSYFVVDLLKILLAKRLNHKLTPKRIISIKKIISLLIIVFGLVLVGRGIFPEELNSLEKDVEYTLPQE